MAAHGPARRLVDNLIELKRMFGIDPVRPVECILFRKDFRRGRIEVVAEVEEPGRPVEEIPVPAGMIPDIERLLGVKL